MTYLLSRAGKAFLRELLQEETLLGFDYDGTLAPIQRRSIDAWLRPKTQVLWSQLCARYRCAVISGRGLADLRHRMEGTGHSILVGNHGMEPDHGRPRGTRWQDQVARWANWLTEALAPLQGVQVEAKRFSLSIHWRGVPHGGHVSRSVWRIAQRLRGARLIKGKQVLNVLPRGAKNKGDAVLYAMGRARCRNALFVGDDFTDEDAFALPSVIGVRVGRKRNTRAQYHLHTQGEVDSLLEFLLNVST
jgi:trehalose 6-phosphate phosphatase